MMRRALIVFFVLVAIGGVGAFYVRGQEPATFKTPEAAIASRRFARAVERSDSAGITRMALLQCKDKGSECYDKFLLELSGTDHIALAMASLQGIAATDESVLRSAHDHAHMIGMRGFDPARAVGETFSTCRVDFQSGCYHGVIQAYLTSLDTIGPAEVAALCSEVPAVRESMWIRFQCAHGLGHGLTMRYEHDLPRGLEGCDLLADGWDRESCYGGAFMENVIATDEHHMPMRITAANAPEKPMDHSAMAHDHGTPAPAFKRIDPDDPQYPCSVVGEAYKRACYGMQTAVMLGQNGYSFEKTARSCDQAPATYRTTCYQSMGTNISGFTLRDTKKSIELCALGTARYQPWCIFGVVKNFIDVTSRAEDGFAFCEALPEGPNRLMCYHAVGEQVYVLNALPDDRSKACERADGVDRDACRLGAGVASVVPEGLPRASQVEMQ